jgi:hypothetical protein
MKSSTILLALASNALVAFVKAIPVVENDSMQPFSSVLCCELLPLVIRRMSDPRTRLSALELRRKTYANFVAVAVKTAAGMSAGCVMEVPAGGDPTKVYSILFLSLTISHSYLYDI